MLDYTLRTVALGSAILGLVSGMLGTFAVLRRQSLLGDAMSHAALPGIALAFLLTREKAPWVLTAGAMAACALAGWTIAVVVRQGRVKYDSALALVLSVFFGVGLVLLTAIQRLPDATQAGLDTFLFGQAAALVGRDVAHMAALGGVALLCLALGWKEFQLLSFDADFARSLGLPAGRLELVLTGLLIIAIVIGLQTVGVVLMSAMIVAPGAAARQWSDRLGPTVLIAGGFGALAGVSGALLSAAVERLPAGPTIVLCASLLVALSLAFGTARGLVWQALRARRQRDALATGLVLRALAELASRHDDPGHPHAEPVVALAAGSAAGAAAALRRLEGEGLVRRHPEGWALTPAGVRAAAEAAR